MDIQKKRFIRFMAILAVDLAAFIIGMVAYNIATKNYWFLIIEGSPVKKALTWMVIGGYAIIVFVINIRLIGGLLSLKGAIYEEIDGIREKYENDSFENYTAEDYRSFFNDVRNEKPKLAVLMDEAISQIDTFYEDKETLKKVMKFKNLDYDVITKTVASSEKLLLQNMKSFIPDVIIWNPKHSDKEELQDSYNELRSSIKSKLNNNNENLKMFNELLMSVRQINDDELQEDYDLKALIDALNYKYKHQ